MSDCDSLISPYPPDIGSGVTHYVGPRNATLEPDDRWIQIIWNNKKLKANAGWAGIARKCTIKVFL